MKAELVREVTIHRDGKAVKLLEPCIVDIDWPAMHDPKCGIVGDQTRGMWQVARFIEAGHKE